MNMIQMFFIVTLVITVITCPVYEPLVWAQIWFYCTILLPPNTFSTWTVFVCYSCDFQVTGFYIICRIICETKSSTTYRVYCRQSMHVSLRCQILQPGQRPHASSASLVECHSCAVAWRARRRRFPVVKSGVCFIHVTDITNVAWVMSHKLGRFWPNRKRLTAVITFQKS